jgi:hypothetical protein
VLQHQISVDVDDANGHRHFGLCRLGLHPLGQRLGFFEQIHRLILSALRGPCGAGSARQLTQVETEPGFDVARPLEANRCQGLDSFLRGGPAQRSDAGVPPRAELDIRRQARVHQPLGVGDRPFVERRNPSRQRFDVGVES